MSKITNDGLTRFDTGCLLYSYGNSGRQRVNMTFVYTGGGRSEVISRTKAGCQSAQMYQK